MWRQGQTHHPIHSHFLGRGDTSLGYRCGDRDRHATPIHSHFWGHGDTSLGYIDEETGTDTIPLYTLISWDVGTLL